MEWLCGDRKETNRPYRFNSATTVMSWNGGSFDRRVNLLNKLQFGHDGDVMEWFVGRNNNRITAELQFGHDGDVMEWHELHAGDSLAWMLQFGHDGDVMEWMTWSNANSTEGYRFNSATTVMSWNGGGCSWPISPDAKLQFGHDGDVMEWAPNPVRDGLPSKLQFGHDGDVMEWLGDRIVEIIDGVTSFNSATTVMSWNGA